MSAGNLEVIPPQARKNVKNVSNEKRKVGLLAKLLALVSEFCELLGASSVGMVGAQGMLQILRC